MRLIILLIVLAIGALLVAQQLRKPNQPIRQGPKSMASEAVQIPSTPQALPAFKKSINKLVNQDNDREKALIRKESQ